MENNNENNQGQGGNDNSINLNNEILNKSFCYSDEEGNLFFARF